jgi:hypothetical protein
MGLMMMCCGMTGKGSVRKVKMETVDADADLHGVSRV